MPDDFEELVEQLQSWNVWMRSAAVKGLGKLGDPRAIAVLLPLLQEAHKFMRKDTIEALKQLGWRPQDAEQEALLAVAEEDWERALGLGTPAIPALMAGRLFESMAPQNVCAALVKMGALAVEALLETAQHSTDKGLRGLALGVLGEIGDQRAVEPLLAIFQGNLGGNRAAAAEALGKLGDPRVVEPLIAVLGETNGFLIPTKATVAKVLGELGDIRAVEALTTLFGDRSLATRLSNGQRILLGGYACDRLGRGLIDVAQALQKLLDGGASAVPEATLRRVATLQDIIGMVKYGEMRYYANGDWDREDSIRRVDYVPPGQTYSAESGWTIEWRVDCSKVRELARQELARRGLEA
jgi:hypothetical protein